MNDEQIISQIVQGAMHYAVGTKDYDEFVAIIQDGLDKARQSGEPRKDGR